MPLRRPGLCQPRPSKRVRFADELLTPESPYRRTPEKESAADMAPIADPDRNALEQQIKDVIQDLFQVMVQVSTYDNAGRSSREVLATELQTLSRSLQTIHATASAANDTSSAPAAPGAASPSTAAAVRIPAPLIEYVENGRNPDIYTREFVELVRRTNQLARGKQRAFAGFRDALAAAVVEGMPELRGDVARAVDETGGGGGGPAAAEAATATAAAVASNGGDASTGVGEGSAV